ncbi:MAG: PIN domain-containing protein [Blastocatellia bacterium]|nr:PIN domain-containing protein [Blastocatellia bacterium]
MIAHEAASPLCFVDSNIWLYALIEGEDADKSARARQVIQQGSLCISAQVINEVCQNLIRKAGMAESVIQELIESFHRKYIVALVSREVMLKASALRVRHSFSFWDSQIVAAALSVGADILYSEDMDGGLVLDSGMRIVNPFVSDPPG